jgi:hypothetical protein
MLFNKIFIQVRKVMINQDISLVYRLFIQLTMRKWCVCVCVCSYTIMLRRFKIHIIDLSIVIYSFEWWWVCRLIPYYKDKWAVHSSDKRKKIEVCIFNTIEKGRNSNGLSERESRCASWLRNPDSETVFRLHTVRPNRYVDEAKKKNDWG